MFCEKCVEKESEMEIVRNKYVAEIERLNQRIERLKLENEDLRNFNERLVLDIAFYNKDFSNLSSNLK